MSNVKQASVFFDTSHLEKKDLKKRSLQGGAVTVMTNGVQLFIQLGSTMILARILTPQDYGILGMVMAFAGMAGLFLNLGLSTATIHRSVISHAQVSTLFWINAGMGFLLMLFLAGLSPVVAWFYKEPELTPVTLALSVPFLLSGLSVQHNALLNRQMRFFSLAVIQVVSMLGGIFVAIFAALQGLGYWALVLNNIVHSICSVSGAWLAVRWIPGLPRRDAGVGSMIKFGADLVAFDFVNYFSRNLDTVLIGRFHGSGPLAMYSKAYQLLMMPIQNIRNPMMQVAMPALSRLQNEPESYRKYYIKFLSILAFLSMPLVAFLYVCSDQIILIVLGDQWIDASVLFKILALVAIIEPVISTQGLVMITTGNSRRYFILGVIGAFLTSSAFIVGIQWGAKGVAVAYAVQLYLRCIPILFFSFKNTPVSVRIFLFAIYKPFLASFMMVLVCQAVVNYLNIYDNITVLLISFIVALFSYLISMIIVSGSVKWILEYYNYFKLVIRKS
jgi:O-antigen/teichoic acid export membrane protein